jgi:DNA-binding transcriptional regulator YdaS (Cro superfamily)
MSKELDALEKAVKKAGGQKPLADAIGTTQGHIWLMLQRGKCGPSYVLPIEKATGVTRQQLRPDIFGDKA